MSLDFDDDCILLVRDAVKQYPGSSRKALDGISFQVKQGEVLGLLGPNGAGKTTIIEIIMGFRSLDSGQIKVLGSDPTRRNNLQKIRASVGLVSQQMGHLRYLTVSETLSMHHALHHNPRGVQEVLEMVGLEEVANQGVRKMSGGQQRRLDVAVALMGRPQLILLDEPTTGFDPAARRRTWEMIENLTKDGTSVLLTTHYMEEATYLADRVVIIGAGKIKGEGTPDELAKKLQLDSIIQARIPKEANLKQLPLGISENIDNDRFLELRLKNPTRVLADLCAWAVEQEIDLDDLSVSVPTLEESYLELTKDQSK